MKKISKFFNFISLVLAIGSFVLMLATDAIMFKESGVCLQVEGTKVIFGEKGRFADVKLAWSALAAFILLIIAILVLLLLVVLPYVKNKAYKKHANLLNFVAIITLVLAWVFIFLTKITFSAANSDLFDKFSLGTGWIIGGILTIISAVITFIPRLVK